MASDSGWMFRLNVPPKQGFSEPSMNERMAQGKQMWCGTPLPKRVVVLRLNRLSCKEQKEGSFSLSAKLHE